MPHTTTKNHRVKRPDTRPNAKTRAKEQRKVADQLKIQDIRITRKLKGEKKERNLTSNDAPLNRLSKSEKLLRALKKKLKSINELMEKKNNGVELNKEQAAKIQQLDQVLEDMEQLLKKSNRKHKEEDDEEEDEDEEEEKEGDNSE
jgi:paraquat-inducible protein B